MLVLEDGLFHPPEDGWGSREYMVAISNQPSQMNLSLTKTEEASLAEAAAAGPPPTTSTGKNLQPVVRPEDTRSTKGLFDLKPATTMSPLIPQLMMLQPPVRATKPTVNPHPQSLLPDPTFSQFLSWAQPKPLQLPIQHILNLPGTGGAGAAIGAGALAGATAGAGAGGGAIGGALQYTMPHILSLLPSPLPFRLLPGESWPLYQARLNVVVDSYRYFCSGSCSCS